MGVAELVPLVLKASIWLTVFAVGLRATPQDLTYALRHPALIGRSLLTMSVLMPVLALVLVKMMSLPPAVALALVALSLAPVPPILPRKQIKAGGDASYAIGLMVAASLLAVIGIPIAVAAMGKLFSNDTLSVAPAALLSLLAQTILVPLAAGVIVRRIAPTVAERIAKVVAPVAFGLLGVSALTLIVAKWSEIAGQAHGGAVLAFGIFILVGLAAGYLSGGPEPNDRSVLAFATASRHPGVAISIVQMNFPHEPAVAPAVLLYLVTSTVITIPFKKWLTRSAIQA